MEIRGAIVVVVLLVLETASAQDEYDDYHYGDLRYSYDPGEDEVPALISDSHILISTDDEKPTFPLCCPSGQVYDYTQCRDPPHSVDWAPSLSGEPDAQFESGRFPSCPKGRSAIELYQKEVFFRGTQLYLPHYIQLHTLQPRQYCIVRIHEGRVSEPCETFQTKVFVCLDEEPESVLTWVLVAIAHILVILTLIAFFAVSELRTLQGQYMICFLISMLIYNICLIPASRIPLGISYVSCIALGSVKYFFFCGVFLWFNVICFDIWRTLKRGQDVSGRRRFLIYSLYTWIVGAVLTTLVLVMPYIRNTGNSKSLSDPLMEPMDDVCKLRMEVSMILQLVQLVMMALNLLFLILGTSNICKYAKFGNGLPRYEAIFCLKQGWKLFLIMLAHTVMSFPQAISNLDVFSIWQYVLLESVALFGVFAYRKTVLKQIYQVCCLRCCSRDSIEQEKGQLTMAPVHV